MKTNLTLLVGFVMGMSAIKAQTNTFPQSGNVGIGTLTPATNLQVIGTTRMGSTNNYAQVDGNGALTFKGSGVYKVGGNKYAFQYSASPGYGLFFNSTDTIYEFRDAATRPVFWVHADKGNGFFSGTLQVSRDALINSITVGIGNGNSSNTAVGYRALYANVGDNNTATGYQALTSNTTGYSNTANGYKTLYSNTTGHSNTANGFRTLYSNTEGYWNIANGYEALYSNTTGNANTANGYWALHDNTTGSWNTATGYEALFNNTANDNTAYGGLALFSNTTGDNNTANGFRALYYNTTGYGNTATGTEALSNNTTGHSNTATGYHALYSNTTGLYNTANGYQTLYSNTTGSDNIAIGNETLLSNTTGQDNVAMGNLALRYNTTGYWNTAVGNFTLNNNITGRDNAAFGFNALTLSTGDYNSAVGSYSLSENTTGYENTGVGHNALRSNVTGHNNTALGNYALNTNQSGNNNTGVGYYANVSAINLTNATAIGYNALVDASNKVRIGNTNITSIGGQVSWTSFSDERVKKDIKENVPGLKFIKLLRTVTYRYDIAKENELLGIKNAVGEEKNDLEKIKFTGLIAQEVDAAAKKIDYDFSGLDKTGKIMGLRYSEFVVPLVKAVQELCKMNDDKDEAIRQQNVKIDELQKQVNELRTMIVSNQSNLNQQRSTIVSPASLIQNLPNPFKNITTINYVLPQQFMAAKIIITDKSGKTIKQVNLSGSGKGSFQLDASALASGVYQYTLYVDEKIIDSKQMILTK